MLSSPTPHCCFSPPMPFPPSPGPKPRPRSLLEELTWTQLTGANRLWIEWVSPDSIPGLRACCRSVRTNLYPCRSEDAEAYELQDGEFSSGIFMKYLKKHILQEKKVTYMLEDVLEGKQ